MAYRISFQNSAGELDFRVVATEDEIKDATAALIEEVADMSAGDKIIVTEIEAR